MLNYWAVLKTSIFMYKLLKLPFGQFLENFGLLYISASGHTKGEIFSFKKSV